MKFDFIEAEKAKYSVQRLCRMLRVSRGGYYASRAQGPSKRAIEDARPGTLVVQAHRSAPSVPCAASC